MRALKTIGREAFGLFVADARFTLALIGWIAIAGVMLGLLDHESSTGALLLFAGFAAILIENLVHVASSNHSRNGGE
jgi:hypothetical protein